MMRIGIDARPAVWYRGTGIGNYTHQLVSHLQRLDRVNEYRLIWPEDCPQPDLPDGWATVPMPRDRGADRPLIEAWLERERMDIYHVPQNGMRAPSRLGGARLVVSIHDLIPFVLPEYVRYSFAHRFLREVPAAAGRAARVITVSRSSAEDLATILRVDRSRIRVIHPAPEEVFRPLQAADRAQAAAMLAGRYGVMRPYLLYVGGITPRKNLLDLVYAFGKVCRQLVPQMTLVIAGARGQHAEQVAGLAGLLGLKTYVHLPGEVPLEDLPALYSLASFCVYPSLYEGFGLPPLEAMACGTPVLCSDAGSLPEVVGRAAMLVPSGDVTSLGEGISRLAGDVRLRECLADRGRRHVARFSWATAAAGILDVYREVSAQEVGSQE
jgi:glycosyltransferase involved in cell wall biosynthesis